MKGERTWGGHWDAGDPAAQTEGLALGPSPWPHAERRENPRAGRDLEVGTQGQELLGMLPSPKSQSRRVREEPHGWEEAKARRGRGESWTRSLTRLCATCERTQAGEEGPAELSIHAGQRTRGPETWEPLPAPPRPSFTPAPLAPRPRSPRPHRPGDTFLLLPSRALRQWEQGALQPPRPSAHSA